MAEGRKSHLSQGGRGNRIQECDQFTHKVNYNTVCGRLLPVCVVVRYLFSEENKRAKDRDKGLASISQPIVEINSADQ